MQTPKLKTDIEFITNISQLTIGDEKKTTKCIPKWSSEDVMNFEPMQNECTNTEAPVMKITENRLEQVFYPPLSFQRYQLISDFVRRDRVLTIADIGCGYGRFLVYMKNSKCVHVAFGLDIDEFALESTYNNIGDTVVDYILPRQLQLRMALFKGSILKQDHRLRGLDAFSCIEIIEHIKLDQLDSFEQNIFGYYRPKIVYITTPNKDFNTLFSRMKAGEFRHWDHKFEWTQAEFHAWCEKISAYYRYHYEITGVGNPPEDRLECGYCTQVVTFRLSAEEIALRNSHNFRYPECQQEPFQVLMDYTLQPNDKVETPFHPIIWETDGTEKSHRHPPGRPG